MQAEKIQMRLQYLDMNNDHMQEYCNHGTLVTTDNVCLDRRVCKAGTGVQNGIRAIQLVQL